MKINGTPDGGGGVIEGLSITSNGIYTAGGGVDGYSPVEVDVQPELQNKTVIENGEYIADQGYYGLGTVTVSVPSPEFVTETLNVSVNNTYYPGTGVDGFSQVVVDVPQSVTGYTAEEITEGQFDFTNIYNGASYVASGVFSGNKSIKTVSLPNCISVYNNAFENCTNLSVLSLPLCKSIGTSAFRGCGSLTTVDLPECKSIDFNVFYRCNSLTQVSLPKCNYIGKGTFDGCGSLTTVDLPECTTISDNAFRNCSILKSISLPKCNYIGIGTFDTCRSLSEIDLPECTTIIHSAFRSCNSLESISLPKCQSIGGLVFENCSALTEIDLPKCTYISGATFNLCSNLTTVKLPVVTSAAQWYGNGVLLGCPNLSQLYIDTEIYGFIPYSIMFSRAENTQLQSGIGSIYVNITNYNKYINADGWSSLSSLFVSVGDPTKQPLLSFSDGLVYGYTTTIESDYKSFLEINSASVTAVSLPECSYINDRAFMECVSLSQVSIPVCEYIGLSAFANCSSLTEVNLPMCSYIDVNAFLYCSSLTQISLPVCEFIASGAFCYCTKLAEIYLPSCSYIDSGVFSECRWVQSVSIPVCEYIGSDAFRSVGQSYIDTITLDLPVCSYIGQYAFFLAKGFKSIYLRSDSVCTLGGNAFDGTNILLYVPASLVDAYKSAQYWSNYSSRIFPIE